MRRVAQECVPGLGVLLDVVLHSEPGQVVFELRRGAAKPAVPPTVAGHDGAGAGQIVGTRGQVSVVDRADSKPVPGCRAEQGEPAAHAEADDPDVLRRVVAIQQPLSRGGDVLDRSAALLAKRPEGGSEATTRTTLREQVRDGDDVPHVGEAVRIPARLLVEPQDLMDDDDARSRLVTRRPDRIPGEAVGATEASALRRQVDHGSRGVRAGHGTTQPQHQGGHTPMVRAAV